MLQMSYKRKITPKITPKVRNMETLKKLSKLKEAGVFLGSEQVSDGRRVVIIRNGFRVYGSKVYKSYQDLNTAWLRAIEYEYNKLNKGSVT